MDSDDQSFRYHHTCSIHAATQNLERIPNSFVLRRKVNLSGTITKHTARLVLNTFMKTDMEGTYSLVVDFSAVNIGLVVVFQKGMIAHQLEV